MVPQASRDRKKGRDQYNKVVRTLNKELMVKLALHVEETRHRKKLEKANTNLTMELTALYNQMVKAKIDVVAEFRTSQPFLDECGVFYGNRFDDCLKQVASVYSDLDLSQVIVDDTVLLTLGVADDVSEETNDSARTIEEKVKSINAVQTIPEGPEAPVAPSIVDSSAPAS